MNKFLLFVGVLCLLAGIAGTVYYFAFFSTATVTNTFSLFGFSIGFGKQVEDIGLIHQKQDGIIISVAGILLGAICLISSYNITERHRREASASSSPLP